MPRFVILEHDHPQLHWDFMLEAGDVLRTWRFAVPPEAGQTCSATQTFDHRLMYLDYEGPISGGRGTVRRWERGECEWREDSSDRIIVRLIGQRWSGVVRLQRKTGVEWTAKMSEATD